MKKINVQQITVPLDFKVACSIYKLGIAEVLQIYIDHVSIYDTFNKTFQDGFTEASHTIVHYIKSKEGKAVNNEDIIKSWELADGMMSNIDLLARTKKRGWKTATKRNYSKCFVEDLFDSTERLYAPSDLLYLDEFSSLKLSKDFCVLCELFHCYPKEFLEYFMGYISLSDAHACEGIKGYTNYIFDFFFKIANGFGRDSSSVVEFTAADLEFHEQMEQFRVEAYIIRDLQARGDALQEFYLSYYLSINPT